MKKLRTAIRIVKELAGNILDTATNRQPPEKQWVLVPVKTGRAGAGRNY